MEMLSREDLQAIVADRAASDPSFRDALLADPRLAVADVIGIDLPAAVRVTVHQETLTEAHLVIPPQEPDALGDDDLELVSGGVCWNHDDGSSCVL